MRPTAICASSEVDMKELQYSASENTEQRQRDMASEPELIDQGVAASRLGTAFSNKAEEQLRLFKTAIGHDNESVIIMTSQPDPPGPEIVYVSPAFTRLT